MAAALIIKPITLVLVIAALFLPSCQKERWICREVVSDCPEFNSAQLLSPSDKAFSGIGVELLRGSFGTAGFLNVYARQITSNDVVFTAHACQYCYTGRVMSGGQRLLLPDAATDMLISTLTSGESVTIFLEGFSTEVCPDTFVKKYRKFSQ